MNYIVENLVAAMLSEAEGYAKSGDGKYWVKNRETGNVYTVKNPDKKKHISANREEIETSKQKGTQDISPDTGDDDLDEILTDMEVEYFKDIEKEHGNSEVYKGTLKRLSQLSKDKVLEIDSKYKAKAENLENAVEAIPEKLKNSIKVAGNSTVFDVVSSSKSLQLRIDVPAGLDRLSSARETQESLIKAGYKAEIRRDGKDVVAQSKDGTSLKLQFKPSSSGGKEKGASQAYEGIVAAGYALLRANISADDVPKVLDNIIKNGNAKIVNKKTGEVVNVGTEEIASVGVDWLKNVNNREAAIDQLRKITESKSTQRVIAASEDIMSNSFGKDWKKKKELHIKCEGGLDTDEFRSDVMVYAKDKKTGENVLVSGISVKDGNTSQLGQLGISSIIGKAKANGVKATLKDPSVLSKLEKIPDGIRENFISNMSKMKNWEELDQNINKAFGEALLKTSSLEELGNNIHSLISWSFIGTNPPKDLKSYIYQNAQNAYNIPVEKSEEGKKLRAMFQKAAKEKKFKVQQSGPNYLITINVDGKDVPFMNIRNKKEKKENEFNNRMYIEKKEGLMPFLQKINENINFQELVLKEVDDLLKTYMK